MKILQKVSSALLLAIIFAIPAFAADLRVSVNSSEQTLTITNLLDSDISLLYLKAGEETFHAFGQIAAQQSIVVRSTKAIPAGLDSATARADGGIAGKQADEGGLYTLTVVTGP